MIRLFGILVFFALKRFDLIRTVKFYTLKDEIETNKSPDDEERGGSPKKEPIKVGRIKVSEDIRKRCGSVRVRPGWHLEYRPDEAEKMKKRKEKEKEKKKNEKKNRVKETNE